MKGAANGHMIITYKKSIKHTTINKISYIDAVVLYIEKNLTDELNPQNIAEQHFISLSQLYRDFYCITGHTVKEYIRKRRISNACERIKCSDMPLSVIANEIGYQTQQAFHKQFKNIVGMTPFEYKRGDTYYYFYPFIFNDISLAVKIGIEAIPECTIAQFYDSCLVGIEDKAIAKLGVITGRVFGRNGKQIGNQLCYEVMAETNGTAKTDLFATCMVNYNEPEISDGWNYLYNIWLSASMFEESGDAYFEEYIFRNGKPRKLKLYLPIKKRKPERHIAIASVPEVNFVIARERGYNAELKASEKVMAFIKENYPIMIRNARRFYVCAYDDVCACGMECDEGFMLPRNSDLEIMRIPTGRYAVLPDDRLGDMRLGSAKIELWLRNNSIEYENQPVFAVYETTNLKYDVENIRMKLYKRLKNDKNG